jgi:hypothetical protein
MRLTRAGSDGDDEENRLRAESERVRANLLRTARELDRRARHAVAVARGLPHSPRLAGALAAAAVAVVGFAVMALAHRVAERLGGRRRARWRLPAHA